MAIRFAVPSTSLSANPVAIASIAQPTCLKLVLVNSGTAAALLTWEDDVRGSSWSIPAGGAFKYSGIFRIPQASGSGAIIVGAFIDPQDDLDAETLFIANKVTTDIGTTNPNPLALESGGNLAAAEGHLASIDTTAATLATQATLAAIKAQTDKLTFLGTGSLRVHDPGS